VVLAHTNVVAGVKLGATLTNNDATCRNLLATKRLNA
jgi:hypothetical protein